MFLSARLSVAPERSGRPAMNPEESVLAERLRRGEDGALTEVYERTHRPLYRYAIAMSGSADIAEDALQETFFQLLRRPENFDPAKGALQGFLFGVIRNLLLKRLGRERREKAPEPLEEGSSGWAETSAGTLLAGAEKAERIAAVRSAVLALPEHYREAVVLCDLEELPYEVAAGVLGCPVGTVRSRLSRARGLLRERLSAYREGGGR
jgi:RNA polymerase sigma-70 factor (ECF subfamily)